MVKIMFRFNALDGGMLFMALLALAFSPGMGAGKKAFIRYGKLFMT